MGRPLGTVLGPWRGRGRSGGRPPAPPPRRQPRLYLTRGDHQTQRQPPAAGPRALATQGRAGRLPLARDWSLASAYRTRDWAQRVQNKILVELKGRGTVGERNLFRRGTWVATWLPQTLAGLGSGRNGRQGVALDLEEKEEQEKMEAEEDTSTILKHNYIPANTRRNKP
ncbi:hypothetical protein O3P69_010011 [Scylla paramamosain]|uniref:Uncharacterized protein n=1 Tax=Scylla paramamosain TaxID=85552 RepID=A0AAW0SP84_SCYPA